MKGYNQGYQKDAAQRKRKREFEKLAEVNIPSVPSHMRRADYRTETGSNNPRGDFQKRLAHQNSSRTDVQNQLGNLG